jgi:hypothetical protein
MLKDPPGVIGGIQTVKCGLCDWEMVYVTPEESEIVVFILQAHAKEKHHKRFDQVNATVIQH